MYVCMCTPLETKEKLFTHNTRARMHTHAHTTRVHARTHTHAHTHTRAHTARPYMTGDVNHPINIKWYLTA